MANIQPQLWIPSGNDYVVDGLWGRLGVQQNFGETSISGSANGLAIKETDDKVFLYAGASNGGVHLRVYDKATDQWGDSWSWISKPGGDYKGSQSIGVLSISDNGQYLAVGQGNPSNYAAVSAPSLGVQLGTIQTDGSIQWLPVPDEAQEILANQNIRSMEWIGTNLIATSWDARSRIGDLIEITTSPQGISTARTDQNDLNLSLSKGAESIIAAGHNTSANPYISIYDAQQSRFVELTGEVYAELQQMLAAQGKMVARTAVFPELINGKIVAFLGTYFGLGINNYINGILRLEINAETREVIDYQSLNISPGEIGSNQAANDTYYGNFSFAVDPFDPTANSVFTGGNQFGSAILKNPTVNGGLVRVDFSGVEPGISDTLYGPKIDTTNNELITPFSPGQPHADSRTIAIYASATGPRLVQTDDGGIWELALQTTPSGSKSATGAWWQSLSTKGLSTLETNMVSWASQSNSIASSYQDNAASLGYYGEDHATNFWVGDGQLAFFDDSAKEDDYAGFLSSYGYLRYGTIVKAIYNKEGFISSRQNSNFVLKRSPDQQAIPWQWTAESLYQKQLLSPTFILPTEANAYKRNSTVISGLVNVYETVEPGDQSNSNTIVLRPLLESNFEPISLASGFSKGLNPTAIDNQGGADQAIISSLYLGALNAAGEPAIYGRTSNPNGDYTLKELNLGEAQEQFIRNGSVVDIAHSHRGNSDTIYWLQGGNSLSFFNYFDKQIEANNQLLGIKQADGTVSFKKLSDLGLSFIENDQWGYQALVFLPGNINRKDQLILGGLAGIWSAELDDNGLPSDGFQPMPWQDLPEGTAPGSYIKTIQYDPQDDLLIAGTQGQGSFIYSLTGDLGERPDSSGLLHISDVELFQKTSADLDKRGNQSSSTITVQLDGRLREPDTEISIEIVLHEANLWREAMDFVSPYDIAINDADVKDNSGTTALQYLNILDTAGLNYRGGREENGDIIMPLTIPAGVNLYNLIINQKEFATARDAIELAYSVRTIDNLNQETATLSLFPDLSSTRASFYGGIPDSFTDSSLSPGALNRLKEAYPSFNLSQTYYRYSLTPNIKTGDASIPTKDPLHQIRTSFFIDTFDQLNENSTAAITSQPNPEAWLFAASVTSQLPITYDPTADFGARFYDFSGDGYADRLSISANASQEQFTSNGTISFGSVALKPSFQVLDSNLILLSSTDEVTRDLKANLVSLRIAADLKQRSTASGSIGYLILNSNENLADFNFSLFQSRARNLITSLGASVNLSAMPENFAFSSEILVNNGQQLMFFEAEGASLEQLSGLDDPRLHWLDPSLSVDGKSLSLSTPSGAEATIAITPGFQGVDPLIADLQNQAPILDFTAFANDQIIDLTLGYGREAALDSVTGWYVIQSKDGAVTAADGNTLRPGDPNYINEAIRLDNRIDTISELSIADGQTRSLETQLSGGVLLAPYAQVSDGDTYVAFAAANSDGLEHFMSLGTNLIGFEDLPNGGDRDFQDAVWNFDFGINQLA